MSGARAQSSTAGFSGAFLQPVQSHGSRSESWPRRIARSSGLGTAPGGCTQLAAVLAGTRPLSALQEGGQGCSVGDTGWLWMTLGPGRLGSPKPPAQGWEMRGSLFPFAEASPRAKVTSSRGLMNSVWGHFSSPRNPPTLLTEMLPGNSATHRCGIQWHVHDGYRAGDRVPDFMVTPAPGMSGTLHRTQEADPQGR